MKPIDLCLLLTAYSFVATALLAGLAFQSRRYSHWLALAMAAAILAASVVTGYYVEPGRGYPELVAAAIRRRDLSAVLAVGWGSMLAAATGSFMFLPQRSWDRAGFSTGLLGSVMALGVTFVACQAFFWTSAGYVTRQPPAYSLDPAFRVQRIADLDYRPIRIIAAEGRVFVCYDYFEEAGDIGGSIVELFPDQPDRPPRLIADSPLLARCYGLAYHRGDLYVSRSGFWGRADRGRIDYAGTGAVTRLSDLDGDGYFEFFDDVVKNLPGVRGPETMHQNNGLCFDAQGNLYVACASSANRALDRHPWGGTVLKVSPDFQKIDVFVRGLRNPFAIICTADGHLLLTDNDVDENPGDELLQLRQGAHYGHPYVLPKQNDRRNDGFAKPLWISEGESNVQGFAHCDAATLPPRYRGGLFVADLLQERVLYFGLDTSGESIRVTHVQPLAVIPSPLDVAATPEGDLYVISRNSRKVYRISPVRRVRDPAGKEKP